MINAFIIIRLTNLMEYFIKWCVLNKTEGHSASLKNITENTNQYTKQIKSTCKKFIIGDTEYNLYTYTLNLPKNKFEDEIYASNPNLLKYLPRACSIIVKNGQIIDSIEGPEKFSGRTDIDEDPEDEQDEIIAKSTGIYDHNKIISWANGKTLEIIETEKANGKFAICKIIFDGEQKMLIAGSKNYHIITTFELLDKTISLQKSNEIMYGILSDIKTNWNKINSKELVKLFSNGYSLAGEFCDGQHFTPGDNTISWFGFFKSGQALDTIQSLGLLNTLGLKTVEYAKVFDSSMELDNIDKIFLASRCKNTEGSVLRCVNTKSGETVLVKTKSVSYIVKRFMRQVILRGYKDIERIKTRFIQAQKYHGLNTNASVRVTNQLVNFAFWMMGKKYPCTVLGVTKVSAVKGQLPNGFNTYWTQWMSETSNSDISIGLEDFGSFDESEYLAGTPLYKQRAWSKPAIVIFFQGLQGSGKSTIGAELCAQFKQLGKSAEYIEQDDYWGDTLACQGALHHAISSESGPQIILVTRCNANQSQYKKYLDIAHKLPCVISFVSTKNFGPLYLMISLAGIVNRSNSGDKLMVGRFEYPFSEVVGFTIKNFNEFEKVSNSKQIDLFVDNSELATQAVQVLKTPQPIQSVEKFVKNNFKKLNGLRLSIKQICSQIISHINNLSNGTVENIITNSNPVYIGLAVDPTDKVELDTIVNTHFTAPGTIYNHHCTLEYFGGKTKVIPGPNYMLPGQIVTAEIIGLVIRKSDNACAFKIGKLTCEGKEIKLKQQPHITGKIPLGEKPACSNGFVGLENNQVKFISWNKTLNLTCFWA